MRESKQEGAVKSQSRQLQETGEMQLEMFSPQHNPLVGISGMVSVPSASSHAAMLNRSPAAGQSSNRQLVLQLQRQYGNRYVNQVVQMARSGEVLQSATALEQDESMKGEAKAVGESIGVSEAHQENKTELPDNLKAGIETLSGISMDDVKVHYNSSKPAQLQALAYTQGTDIYVGSSQEKHLPHEAWHVVQQKIGKVSPTGKVNDHPVNDDPGLEKEADQMGAKSLQLTVGVEAAALHGKEGGDIMQRKRKQVKSGIRKTVVQRRIGFEFETGDKNNGAFIYYRDGGQDRLFADEATVFTASSNFWKIVVDGGRMEFVTEPLSTDHDIKTATTEIQHFIDEVQTSAHGANIIGLVPGAGTWTQNYQYTSICVASDLQKTQQVRDSSFFGNPQISVGIRADKLGQFTNEAIQDAPFQGLENAMIGIAQKRYQNDPAKVQRLTTDIQSRQLGRILDSNKQQIIGNLYPQVDQIVQTHSAGLQPFEVEEFRGFLKYLAMQVRFLNYYNTRRWEYINNGKEQPGYMKKYFSIMPRTDFHSTYNRMAPNVQKAIVAAHANFVQTFAFLNDSTLGYTLDDFFQSISNPQDQRNARNVDKMSAAAPYKNQTDQSLGQLSHDADDRNKIVLELRHITSANMPFGVFVTNVLPQVNSWIRKINNE